MRLVALVLSLAVASPSVSLANNSNSGNNSSDGSLNDSSDSDGEGSVTVVVISLVLVGAGITIGLVRSRKKSRENEAKSAQALARYLKRYHAMVTRDLSLADGPVLQSWLDELGLTEADARAFRRDLDGSGAQLGMLEVLAGDLNADTARVFAKRFNSVVHRVVGEARYKTIVDRVVLKGT